MSRLCLVPIYLGDRQKLLQPLSDELKKLLHMEILNKRPSFDPEMALDKTRGQYNSTSLLRMLLEESTDSADYILGVADIDLFIPVLTYVFGEAQLDGRAAVVSTHRLRPDVYGLPDDDELLFNRLLTESIHELGPWFGLIHCHVAECVMHASTYVEEVDLKSAAFCPSCQAAVVNA